MKFYLKIHILYRLLIFTVNALILLLPKNNFDVMHVISVFIPRCVSRHNCNKQRQIHKVNFGKRLLINEKFLKRFTIKLNMTLSLLIKRSHMLNNGQPNIFADSDSFWIFSNGNTSCNYPDCYSNNGYFRGGVMTIVI